MSTLIIDGKKLDFLYVQEGFKIPSFNMQTEIEKIPGRAGGIPKRRDLNALDFDLPIIIDAGKHTSPDRKIKHDDVMNEIVKLCNKQEAVKLQFSDMDWYWNAFIDGPFEIDKSFVNGTTFSLKVILADPYKYAVNGNQNTAISDQVSIVNSGTADTPIIVEARALKAAPYFMITKSDQDYFMVGDDDTTKKIENLSPTVLADELGSFTGWNTVPIGTILNDNILGGTVAGKFKIWDKGESFAIDDGGKVDTGYHGPALRKYFNRNVNDFNLITKMYVNQRTISAGKAFSYVYDEMNNLRFVIGFINQYRSKNESKIVVYAYNDAQEPKLVYEHKTLNIAKRYKALAIYIQLIRQGDDIQVKTWKYDEPSKDKRSTPFDVHSGRYLGWGKLYPTPIKSITLFSGVYANYSEYLEINWLGIYLYEKLPKEKGVQDYAVKEGDLVYIDTSTNNVLIEGEPALHLKNFGSDFFNVDSGYTELLIYPTGVFDTTVKWQDRYY